MGELISLAERRWGGARTHGRTRAAAPARVSFHFDLASPATYLAADMVDRLLPQARWRPACAASLHRGDDWIPGGAERVLLEARAATMRLPLSWPERFTEDARRAMRAAAYAEEVGRGSAFVLAAARLGYCGGFDLDDPEVLAEAAAAAGVPLEGCLQAAADLSRDAAIEGGARRLLALGATRLPVIRVGQALFCGEERVGEACAAARARVRPSLAV